jgi:AraC-like DNA-binding protein
MDEPHREWSTLHHDQTLRLDALQAVFTRHAFARHWHDYYVIGLVEDGAQRFWCRRETFLTPRGGLIVLNPGEAHTGEAATGAGGFAYRALYPTVAHFSPLMAALGQPDVLPQFPANRIDDPMLAAAFLRLHSELGSEATPIETETRWLALLTQLVSRYAAERPQLPKIGAEPQAIVRAKDYLEAHSSEAVVLIDLSAHVGLSPFHLVRAFRRAVGVPPHSYLESLRIRHAQQLLAAELPLAEIAYTVGYSSQSHFTTRFRRIIGVTPGQFRSQKRRA